MLGIYNTQHFSDLKKLTSVWITPPTGIPAQRWSGEHSVARPVGLLLQKKPARNSILTRSILCLVHTPMKVLHIFPGPGVGMPISEKGCPAGRGLSTEGGPNCPDRSLDAGWRWRFRTGGQSGKGWPGQVRPGLEGWQATS